MEHRFNEDGLVLSSGYEETMNRAVLPFLEERKQAVTVKGWENKPLSCAVYRAPQPRGTVVMVHGFTENACKFSELIYSLLQNDFCVVAYDQRGHGFSWRDEKLQSDPSLTHVSDFNEYVGDLEAVCDQTLNNMPKPYMIFSHSMGGAVTSLFLERHQDVFSRAVLCAPMIMPNLGGIPAPVTSALCRVFKLFGQGKKRVFVTKPYAGPEDFSTSCATGRERFDWYDKIKQANREYWNNGPTYGWTLESIKVNRWLLAKGAVEKIACPVLLFTADQDGSVMPEDQARFIARVKQGKKVFVKDARHEIYRSEDTVLFPWWHSILAFLKEA